jgi:hypothetical protein
MPRSTHLLIKLYSRDSFSKFIKAVSGIIARIVLGVEKGKNWGLKFWEGIPFSRIINDWAKGYITVKEYITRNELESCGVIPYVYALRLVFLVIFFIRFIPICVCFE